MYSIIVNNNQTVNKMTTSKSKESASITALNTGNNIITELQNTISALQAENQRLNELHDLYECEFQDPEQPASLRTQMLIAMLPQVRLDHAKCDAQRVEKAVDEAMEVWGLI